MLPTSCCSWILAWADLALAACSQISGPMNAMMPARRTKTMTISRIVKPRWRGSGKRCLIVSTSDRQVVDGKHRRKDGEDDEADDRRHGDDHHGLQEGQRLSDRDLDLVVVGFGHLHEHVVQAPGLLADLHHVHPEHREAPGLHHRAAQPPAFLELA